MPLVRREDSVFVVVDAQPGFFAPEDEPAKVVDADRVDGRPGRAARRARRRGRAPAAIAAASVLIVGAYALIARGIGRREAAPAPRAAAVPAAA